LRAVGLTLAWRLVAQAAVLNLCVTRGLLICLKEKLIMAPSLTIIVGQAAAANSRHNRRQHEQDQTDEANLQR